MKDGLRNHIFSPSFPFSHWMVEIKSAAVTQDYAGNPAVIIMTLMMLKGKHVTQMFFAYCSIIGLLVKMLSRPWKKKVTFEKLDYYKENKKLKRWFFEFFALLLLFQWSFHPCLWWPFFIKIYNYFPIFEKVIRTLRGLWSSFCDYSFLIPGTSQIGSRQFL